MQTAKMMLSGIGWVDMAGLSLLSKVYSICYIGTNNVSSVNCRAAALFHLGLRRFSVLCIEYAVLYLIYLYLFYNISYTRCVFAKHRCVWFCPLYWWNYIPWCIIKFVVWIPSKFFGVKQLTQIKQNLTLI